MGEVISLQKIREVDKTLNDFLKEAHDCNLSFKLDNPISVLNPNDFVMIFRNRAFQEICKRGMINTEAFICVTYVAEILKEIMFQAKKSWIVSDYLIKAQKNNNPRLLREAANICFLICAVFPKRANWRLMNKDFYQNSGAMCYYSYYLKTQKSFAYYMNKNFKDIVNLTAFILASFK